MPPPTTTTEGSTMSLWLAIRFAAANEARQNRAHREWLVSIFRDLHREVQ